MIFLCTKTIYDFGQNTLEKSMVDQEIMLNDEVVREIKQTIILGVTNAYFETLTALSVIKSYESALQQLNEQLNYSENLYKIGKDICS
ncbi:MAG: TolC family protein [Flavobacteriaceae bacterium]|nr:TolC family protein [Flavobacteriaceae bacterium]